jgi:UDP-N-acetylglucosamine acyltransferase
MRAVRQADRGGERRTTLVDPRAAVDESAELGAGCRVDAYAVIGPGVRLGDGCRVRAHAVLLGPCELEADNDIHSFACIGGEPQDLRHRGEPTRLEIGAGNVFREHVTVSRGTVHGGGTTRIGEGNLLMACCHVAHDCRLGDRVVMANNATLAGHVEVQDCAVFGGMVAVGAFLRIGESAMLAAGSMIERDVPPFCIAAGDRARLCAVNRVGLDRRGISQPARTQIKEVFRALRAHEPIREITARLEDREDVSVEALRMVRFLAASERGVTR